MSLRLLFGVLLGAVLILAACGDDDDGGDATGTPQAQAVAVEAGDFFFEPLTLTVASGAPVTVHLASSGQAPHTFTIDELGVDQRLKAAETVTVRVPAAEPGEYRFYCQLHPDRMEGTLTVLATATATIGARDDAGASPAATDGDDDDDDESGSGTSGGGYGY